MIIDSDGTVNPCCYWGAYGNVNLPMGNANLQTIDEIRNGEEYRRLRRHMAQGDLEAAGCARCYAIKQGFDLQLLYDADGEHDDSAYGRNIRTLKGEVAAGAEILEARPTLLAIAPSHHCHLRCLHCSQEPSRTAQLRRAAVMDEVEAHTPVLVRLNAVGGEPFILPVWRSYLRRFAPADNPYLCFSTCTSASLVADEIFEQLQKFKSINVNISLDGTGDVYERVRRNAQWQTVVANLDRFRAIVDAKPGSAIGISMSVMRSNIADLPNLVRFAADRRLLFSAIPVSTPLPESLASFADGPMEVRAWRLALDDARRLVEAEWLPRYYGADAVGERERAAWVGAIDLLDQAIPWDMLARPHFRVRVTIPAGVEITAEDGGIRRVSAAVGAGADLYVHLFPAGDSRRTAPYHARVAGGDGGAWFEVALPAGRVEAYFGDKWAPSHRDWVTITVPAGAVAGAPLDVQWLAGPWSLLWRGARGVAALRRRLPGRRVATG